MANIRAGVAYIDVRLGSIERFKREVEEKVKRVGKDSGEKMSTEVNESFTKETRKIIPKVAKKAGGEFAQNFGDNLVKSGSVLRIGFVAWAIPAAVAAGPFIGAALGAAIVAGIPLAVIAGGIALIADHPKIKKAGKKLGDTITKDAKKAALPLVAPTLQAMKLIRETWKSNLKDIKTIFKDASQFLLPLTKGLLGGISPIIKGIKDVVKNAKPVIDVLSKGFTRIGTAIGEMLTKISSDPEAIKGMADALDDLIGIIIAIINWFGRFVLSASKAYSQFKETWGAIKEWWDTKIMPSFIKAGEQAKTAWAGITGWWNKILNSLGIAANQAKALWKGVADWFTGTIVPSFKKAGDQFMSAWNAVKNWFIGLGKWFKDRWNDLKNAVSSAVGSMNKAVVNGVGSIVGYLRSLPGKAVSAVSGLASKLYNAGWNAMMGFYRGIVSVAGGIIQKARDIANSVVSTIKGALSIFSPSRVMMDLGKMTMLGFEKGMEMNKPDIASMLPKNIPSKVDMNFGSMREPQMDRSSSAALQIENYIANENVDPWRQAEDWYFMVSARGGVA